MKTMSRSKLAKLVSEGDAVVIAYSTENDTDIILETYDREGRAKRQEVTLTGKPVATTEGA